MSKLKKLQRTLRRLSKGECFVIATTPLDNNGDCECAGILSKQNRVVRKAFYASLVNSVEIKDFILGVVGEYLSRYEVDQRAFIESLK